MPDATTLRSLALARLEDARVLYDNGRYDGAAYICGYTVELALKARICDTLCLTEYPEDLHDFKTHELERLLRLSGRYHLKPTFLAEWSTVEGWKPETRYRTTNPVPQADALAFIQAADTLLRQL